MPRKPLAPRTYRIAAGQSVLIGGLARVDVIKSPSATIYLTLWASGDVVTHYGKTEDALQRQQTHAGTRLTPPLGDEKRLQRLGPLVPTDLTVDGSSFRASNTDIAIAGLGWIGVALNGEADLRVWAPDGVAITTHAALVPDLGADLQRPGFSSDVGGTAPPSAVAKRSPKRSQGKGRKPSGRR